MTSFEIPLIPDITNNVLSDYLEYDQLQELMDGIKNLRVNSYRIKESKTIHENKDYTITTKIDGLLRKEEKYNRNNAKIEQLSYNTNGKLDGLQTGWWGNGNKEYEKYYKNGVAYGIQRGWFLDGGKKYDIAHCPK